MGPRSQYLETVLTCKGDYYSPDFHRQLSVFRERLQRLIFIADEQSLILKKVEPWNSVRVTLKIPADAALRLRELAERRDSILRELGVLAVQIDGDRVISLTVSGENKAGDATVATTHAESMPVPLATTSEHIAGSLSFQRQAHSTVQQTTVCLPPSDSVPVASKEPPLSSSMVPVHASVDGRLQQVFVGDSEVTTTSTPQGFISWSDGFTIVHPGTELLANHSMAALPSTDIAGLCFITPSKLAGMPNIASSSPLLVNLLQTRRDLRTSQPQSTVCVSQSGASDMPGLMLPPPVKRRRSQTRKSKQPRCDSEFPLMTYPTVADHVTMSNRTTPAHSMALASASKPDSLDVAMSAIAAGLGNIRSGKARHMINPYTGNLELVDDTDDDILDALPHSKSNTSLAVNSVLPGSSVSTPVSVTAASMPSTAQHAVSDEHITLPYSTPLSAAASCHPMMSMFDNKSLEPSCRLSTDVSNRSRSVSHALPLEILQMNSRLAASIQLSSNVSLASRNRTLNSAVSSVGTSEADRRMTATSFSTGYSGHADWFTAAAVVEKPAKPVIDPLTSGTSLSIGSANGPLDVRAIEQTVRQSGLDIRLLATNPTVPAGSRHPLAASQSASLMPSQNFPYISVRLPFSKAENSVVSMDAKNASTPDAVLNHSTSSVPSTSCSSSSVVTCLRSESLVAYSLAKPNGCLLPVYGLADDWSKTTELLQNSVVSRQGLIDIAMSATFASERPPTSASTLQTSGLVRKEISLPDAAITAPSVDSCFFPSVSCFPPDQRKKSDARPCAPGVGLLTLMPASCANYTSSLSAAPYAVRSSVLSSSSLGASASGTWSVMTPTILSTGIKGLNHPSSDNIPTVCSATLTSACSADIKTSLSADTHVVDWRQEACRRLLSIPVASMAAVPGGQTLQCVTRAPLTPDEKLPAVKAGIANLKPFSVGQRFQLPVTSGSVHLSSETESTCLLGVGMQSVLPQGFDQCKAKVPSGSKTSAKHSGTKERRGGTSRSNDESSSQRGSGKSHLTVAQLLDLAKNAKLNQIVNDEEQKAGEHPLDPSQPLVPAQPSQMLVLPQSSSRTVSPQTQCSVATLQRAFTHSQSASIIMPIPGTSLPPHLLTSSQLPVRQSSSSILTSQSPPFEVTPVSSSGIVAPSVTMLELPVKITTDSARSCSVFPVNCVSAMSTTLSHMLPLTAFATVQPPLLITSPRYPLNLTESVKKAMRGVGLYPSPPASPTVPVSTFTSSKLMDIRPFASSTASFGRIGQDSNPEMSIKKLLASVADRSSIPSLSQEKAPDVRMTAVTTVDTSSLGFAVTSIVGLVPDVRTVSSVTNIEHCPAAGVNASLPVMHESMNETCVDDSAVACINTAAVSDVVPSSTSTTSDGCSFSSTGVHVVPESSQCSASDITLPTTTVSAPLVVPVPDTLSTTRKTESVDLGETGPLAQPTAEAENSYAVEHCASETLLEVQMDGTEGLTTSFLGAPTVEAVTDNAVLDEVKLNTTAEPVAVATVHDQKVENADRVKQSEDCSAAVSLTEVDRHSDNSTCGEVGIECSDMASAKTKEPALHGPSYMVICHSEATLESIGPSPELPRQSVAAVEPSHPVTEPRGNTPTALLRPRRKRAADGGQPCDGTNSTMPAERLHAVSNTLVTRMTTRSSRRATAGTTETVANEVSHPTKVSVRRTSVKVVEASLHPVTDLASVASHLDLPTELPVAQKRMNRTSQSVVPAAVEPTDVGVATESGSISRRSRRQTPKVNVGDMVMPHRRRISTRGTTTNKHADVIAGDDLDSKDSETCVESDLMGPDGNV